MSEFINNVTRRKETLKSILRQLHAGKAVDEVKAEFAALADEISAEEIAEVEQALISEGMPVSEVHDLCDVHVAVMRDALERGDHPEAIPGHPLHTFKLENDAAESALQGLRRAFEAYKAHPEEHTLAMLRRQAQALLDFERHYSRKENILFPYLEKYDFYGPSQVMWQTHDQIRALWKSLLKALPDQPSSDPAQLSAIQAILDPLEQTIRDMFYKEDKILFPTALKLLKEADWVAARRQESEIGYFTVQPGSQWPLKATVQPAAIPVQVIGAVVALKPAAEAASAVPAANGALPLPNGGLPLQTGALSLEQIDLMLRSLPVDITFVDENDEVRFFSQTPERIFPRTEAIIGRKVQKCHPPQSVHRVQQIVDDFRSGARSEAEFWIQMGGKFVHIRYFALRDAQGAYRGTLEVTQEVSSIRALQGERRLVDGAVPGA
jgi:DUF438 domain-containing protein